MSNGATPTRVEYRRGAVYISDRDPFDAMMLSNARKVLAHAEDLAEQPGVTRMELSFAVRMLAASLHDMLYLTDAGDD